MISQILMELDHSDISYKKASNLQGALFEATGSAFAEKMHAQNLHPYSQYIRTEQGKTIWVVNALNTETAETLTETLMKPGFDSFRLRFGKNGMKRVQIIKKSCNSINDSQLIDEFQQVESVDRFHLAFLTPASFRQNGKYVLYPDIRLLFQNLITRCNFVTDQSNGMEADPGLLSEIAKSSIVTKYAMKTEQFPFERTWVPGFMGFLDIRLTGEEMLKRYVRFLLRFGEYSGVGIKTGMGMGAMCVSFDGKCGSRDECNDSETI